MVIETKQFPQTAFWRFPELSVNLKYIQNSYISSFSAKKLAGRGTEVPKVRK